MSGEIPAAVNVDIDHPDVKPLIANPISACQPPPSLRARARSKVSTHASLVGGRGERLGSSAASSPDAGAHASVRRSTTRVNAGEVGHTDGAPAITLVNRL